MLMWSFGILIPDMSLVSDTSNGPQMILVIISASILPLTRPGLGVYVKPREATETEDGGFSLLRVGHALRFRAAITRSFSCKPQSNMSGSVTVRDSKSHTNARILALLYAVPKTVLCGDCWSYWIYLCGLKSPQATVSQVAQIGQLEAGPFG